MAYTYKFIRLPVRIGAKLSKHPDHPSYQDVINEYAGKGWRFVQLLIECPAAIPNEYILVFEKSTAGRENAAPEENKLDGEE